MEQVLGHRLAALREAAGLTQDELAVKVGMSRVSISRLETGDAAPRQNTLRKLAAALDVPLTAFDEATPAAPKPAPAAPGKPAPAVSDAVGKLLDHITQLTQQHADALKAAKKEARRQEDKITEHYEFAMKLITNQRDAAERRVEELERELAYYRQAYAPGSPAGAPVEPTETQRKTVEGLRRFQVEEPEEASSFLRQDAKVIPLFPNKEQKQEPLKDVA